MSSERPKKSDLEIKMSLVNAVRTNDEAKVDAAIAGGARISEQDPEGNTAMHIAVNTSNKMQAKILDYYDRIVLKRKKAHLPPPVNIFNIQAKDGYTPLHEAVVGVRPYSVLEMLLRGADPSIRDKDGVSPASHRWYERQKNDKVTTSYGVTPGSDAWFERVGTGEVITPYYRGSESIRSMVTDERFRDPAIDKKLLQEEYITKIATEMAAARQDPSQSLGHKKTMRKVHASSRITETREARARVGTSIAIKPLKDPLSMQEFFEADIRERNYDELRKSLREPAYMSEIDINANLSYISTMRHPKEEKATDSEPTARHRKVRMLDGGINALALAARSGDYELTTILLEAKANVNSVDSDGNTVLHHAASSLNPEVIVRLVESGANIDAKNHKGETPLHIIARKGFPEIRRLPSSTQSRSTMPYSETGKSSSDETMLHYASPKSPGMVPYPFDPAKYTNAMGLYNYLVKMGASTSEPDMAGKTPGQIILSNAGIRDSSEEMLSDPTPYYLKAGEVVKTEGYKGFVSTTRIIAKPKSITHHGEAISNTKPITNKGYGL